jgi:hypothetical protein
MGRRDRILDGASCGPERQAGSLSYIAPERLTLFRKLIPTPQYSSTPFLLTSLKQRNLPELEFLLRFSRVLARGVLLSPEFYLFRIHPPSPHVNILKTRLKNEVFSSLCSVDPIVPWNRLPILDQTVRRGRPVENSFGVWRLFRPV